MVGETAMGRVGLIVALEVSRLSRSNADWYHLLDICSVRGTLLADAEAVYDPRDPNHRLLLGMKGTFGETELSMMQQRLVEAMRSKAQRGEFRYRLPPGFVWDEAGRLVKDPDQRVQSAIALVFERFARFGTVHTVHRSLAEDGLCMPMLCGPKHALVWKVPSSSYLYRMLKNPLFAGAYVWGQRQVVEELDEDHRPIKRVRNRPKEEWPVLLRDNHEGYIDWETYQRNQRQIQSNARSHPGAGPPREGTSLLQGLVLCGRCGRRLQVRYTGGRGQAIRYVCTGNRDASGRRSCQDVGATRLELALEQLVLEALAPAGMEAMLLALEANDEERLAERRHLENRVERARYEVALARRQYDAVDPQNRLVAAELERRWERALVALQATEQEVRSRLDELSRSWTEAEREQLVHYAAHLPELWHAETTRPQDRKRIVRCLIEQVVVEGKDDAIGAQIHWQGGEVTPLRVPRPRRGERSQVDDLALVELVAELAEEFSDSQIARILIRKGLSTATGKAFNRAYVATFRGRHGIDKGPAPPRLSEPDVYTAVQAAELLHVDTSTIIRWVEAGVLQGAQVTSGAPWRIRVTAGDMARLRPAEAPPDWLSLKAAAAALGMSQQTVLARIDAGDLEAVRTQCGRRALWRVRLPRSESDAQGWLFGAARNGLRAAEEA
jgi:hypothetical protein